MTQEEVTLWLNKLMMACLGLVFLCGVVLFVGFTAGYATEKYAEVRSAKCINSACETPCKPGQKFKRHEGCVK